MREEKDECQRVIYEYRRSALEIGRHKQGAQVSFATSPIPKPGLLHEGRDCALCRTRMGMTRKRRAKREAKNAVGLEVNRNSTMYTK